jgi:two-component system chemotaxis response regulator CheY
MDQKLQILVVEDEKFMRDLICRVLNDMGYKQVLGAEDGQAALKLLQALKRGIGLIFLDIEMPKISGLEFLHIVRNSPSSPNKNVPVVMLTGHSDIDNLREAAKLGIHGFLTKPVSKASLEKQIKHAQTSPPIDPSKLMLD